MLRPSWRDEHEAYNPRVRKAVPAAIVVGLAGVATLGITWWTASPPAFTSAPYPALSVLSDRGPQCAWSRLDPLRGDTREFLRVDAPCSDVRIEFSPTRRHALVSTIDRTVIQHPPGNAWLADLETGRIERVRLPPDIHWILFDRDAVVVASTLRPPSARYGFGDAVRKWLGFGRRAQESGDCYFRRVGSRWVASRWDEIEFDDDQLPAVVDLPIPRPSNGRQWVQVHRSDDVGVVLATSGAKWEGADLVDFVGPLVFVIGTDAVFAESGSFPRSTRVHVEVADPWVLAIGTSDNGHRELRLYEAREGRLAYTSTSGDFTVLWPAPPDD